MATQTQTPAPPPSYTSGPGSVQAGRPTTQAEINSINSQIPGLYTYQQPTTPAPSGVTSTSPVITSNMAQKDYADKLKNFQNLQAQISQQKSLMAQQAAQRATDDAQKELQKSEQVLKEQQLGIQQQQADTAQADAEAKRQALSMSYSTSTSTSTPSTTPPTPAPTVPPAVVPDPTQEGLNSAVDQKLTGLSDIQTARDSITQQSNSALQSLLNGSIPLTPSQQTLVGSLQAQLALNVADQKQANASYTGAVTTAGFRAGGEYTAEQYAGNIHAAVSLGVLKIQRLDNEAAKTIAELEQSFQKGNYDIINKQYDNLTKSLDEKAATLKDTYDTVTKALQDQRDYNYKVTQDEFDNKLKVATFNETVKKNALDAIYTKAQIDKIYADISATEGAGDPGQTLAYAQQYASTGMIPTGLPKGTFGAVSQVAKTLPKPEGTLVDVNTGVKSGKLSAAQDDGIVALYDIQKKISTLQQEFDAMQTGVIGGTGVVSALATKIPIAGQLFGADTQAKYEATRKELVDLLARARTGAQLNPSEEAFYSSMLPSKWSQSFYIGPGGQTKIDKFKENMKSILDSKLKVNGVSIYGYSKTKIGDKEYTVGDIVRDENNNEYRILPDGSAVQLN